MRLRAAATGRIISRSRSGEIGIRTRLKIWRGHTHVGSSPTSGTTQNLIYHRDKLLEDIEQPSKPPLKPPLKWAGGKRWLVSQVAVIWEQHAARRYVEPFCGGLAVALGLTPRRAVLNDINPHLINFFCQVQRGLEVSIDMRNDERTFYAHRNRFNELISQEGSQTPEAAQLFYYLNRTCFNGLCRFNRAGEFNVPFGTYKKISYATDFHQYVNLFKDWVFTNRALEELPLEKDDFVYADPPYDVQFTTYSAGGFSWEDQVRTAELLAAHPGPVVLSNQATPRIVSLYEKLRFTLKYLEAPRRISCTGDRTAAREVLAVKAGKNVTDGRARSVAQDY